MKPVYASVITVLRTYVLTKLTLFCVTVLLQSKRAREVGRVRDPGVGNGGGGGAGAGGGAGVTVVVEHPSMLLRRGRCCTPPPVPP